MAMGLRNWANDNDNHFPWKVVPTEGGSKDAANWTDHLRACSNEFFTPVFLACPTDLERTPLMDWKLLIGDRHISYFLGVNALEAKPDTILSVDRHLIGGGGGN